MKKYVISRAAAYTFAAALTCCSSVFAQASAHNAPVEPNAGKWKTWIVSSGAAFRAGTPPGMGETHAEIREIQQQMSALTNEQLARIRYWDAGAPAYRWMDMLERQVEAGEPLTAHPHRVMAYVAVAMHDATVAAWESKYHYSRARPTDFDSTLKALVDVPASPSYPSEHSVTAAAAAEVLSHFFPAKAAQYAALAEEAGMSRVQAGVQYPSDHTAGIAMGKQIAQKVIERIAADRYTTTWTGTVPTGTCMWTGRNPGNAAATQWRPFLLNHAGEFRPPAPPDCQSEQMRAETELVRAFTRTFNTNERAFYWQSAEGRETKPFIMAEKWMFEDKLDRNPPRVARMYALLNAAHYDTFIASQDAKFAYWYLRPHQLDSGITPLFNVPNFPSYPSNHASFSWSRAEMLSYFFPHRAAEAQAMAKSAADSRVHAGIHYPVDAVAGKELGTAVARKFIEWAERDGSDRKE